MKPKSCKRFFKNGSNNLGLLLWAVIFLLIIAVAGQAQTTATVRGRVDRAGGPHGRYPAANISVRLLAEGTQNSIRPSVTGTDGLYYFSDIRPGNYRLEISGQGAYQVVISAPHTDIPPILLQ